ncbi:MAG TPA: hypothetical protein VJV22_16490 [Acidobacteriaceae bacterium]|nr:hypothetical protein [Acidobacteriaceae bacterium]
MSDLEQVRERFGELDLHDSRLNGIHLERRDGENVDRVRLDLELLEGSYPEYQWRPVQLAFCDCAFVKVEIDLLTKALCGGAISGSECLTASSARDQIEAQMLAIGRNPAGEYGEHPLADCLEFVLGLCPPGGELHVFAKEFALSNGLGSPCAA